ncbi:MAG TPA: hypothetical protein VML92_01170 [Steroidobacteraceae bacterium]|nr:hypothetical protein [Steroidobacteraceae bacterium]
MTGRSLQRRQLSCSKIDLFVECPRCLYLDVARGVNTTAQGSSPDSGSRG